MVLPMSTKGFTLPEILLVLFISVSFMLIFPFYKPQPSNSEIELFESEVIHQQFMAILTHQGITVSSSFETAYPIHFNNLGNLYTAQTIVIDQKELVMSLGPGRIYEKSQYLD